MKQHTEIDLLKNQVLQSPSIYQWHYSHKDYGRKFVTLALIIAAFILAYNLEGVASTELKASLGMASAGIIMSLDSNFLFIPDYEYHYTLTKNGLITIQEDKIPALAYKLIAWFAWVGVVICLLAAVLLNPIAVAGAIGCALMAFKIGKLKHGIRQLVTPFIPAGNYEFDTTTDPDQAYIAIDGEDTDYTVTFYSEPEQINRVKHEISRFIRFNE